MVVGEAGVPKPIDVESVVGHGCGIAVKMESSTQSHYLEESVL